MNTADWETHPGKLLLDAIHDAYLHADIVERKILYIADKLEAVGLDKLARECVDAVSGLSDALARVRYAHSDSQTYSLRESERGIANMLTIFIDTMPSVTPAPARKEG